MTRWHTLRKPFAMLDATLWGLALRLIALMRARYSGKAQNNVQNETSRVCVLGGTELRTSLYSEVRNWSTSLFTKQTLGISDFHFNSQLGSVSTIWQAQGRALRASILDTQWTPNGRPMDAPMDAQWTPVKNGDLVIVHLKKR